jgi:hypothetical protein
MKRLFKFIALVITLAVTLTAGVMAHRLFFKPSVWLSSSSPSRTYTVELTGNKSRSFYHAVGFNLIKNGQTLVRNAHAHSGDWMDIIFELAYPQHSWESENVLRFWRGPDAPEKKPDMLLVSNGTGKVIRYLKVNAKDMFLIFDVEPKSTLELRPSHQSWLGWVECEGEFMDGKRISWKGVNFFHRDTIGEPLKYCVSISDGGVRIESPQIEGYDSNGSGDNPNIPKVRSCDPLVGR